MTQAEEGGKEGGSGEEGMRQLDSQRIQCSYRWVVSSELRRKDDLDVQRCSAALNDLNQEMEYETKEHITESDHRASL